MSSAVVVSEYSQGTYEYMCGWIDGKLSVDTLSADGICQIFAFKFQQIFIAITQCSALLLRCNGQNNLQSALCCSFLYINVGANICLLLGVILIMCFR